MTEEFTLMLDDMPVRTIRTNGHGIPIIALDIDGTLGDYHSHFLWFAENWLNKKMPSPMDLNPGLPLHIFMGVSHEIYRECKLAFRQGGLKRFMPAYPRVAELSRGIREQGAEVWICTTRPYLRLDNIDPDTRDWLARNGIEYDAVLFGDQKYAELKRQAGDRVAGVIDDLPEQCEKAIAEGFNVAIREQPYNDTWRSPHVSRVNSAGEMMAWCKTKIYQWKVVRDVVR
jgi:hypothetical protein